MLGWTVRGSNPGKCKRPFSINVHNGSGGRPVSYILGTRILSQGWSGLVLRLRISGAKPLLPVYVFKAWTGKPLPLPDLVECYTVTLTKTEKLLNDFAVITICSAKLHVWRRPRANEHSFVFIVAPCILKIHLLSHTNKCANYIIYYLKSVLIIDTFILS
jgi:hypothetical protein